MFLKGRGFKNIYIYNQLQNTNNLTPRTIWHRTIWHHSLLIWKIMIQAHSMNYAHAMSCAYTMSYAYNMMQIRKRSSFTVAAKNGKFESSIGSSFQDKTWLTIGLCTADKNCNEQGSVKWSWQGGAGWMGGRSMRALTLSWLQLWNCISYHCHRCHHFHQYRQCTHLHAYPITA